ncbi:hypothetical protein [Arenimonas sp.]|uniref:hypothetical protein n=1 Tax=Arenimonas sp. TaxID=1872635 RepID=UPI0025C56779|nr:hypothetical protein [Arenimonas sp.]
MSHNNVLIHDINSGGVAVLLFGAVLAAMACLGGYIWGEDNAIERLQAREQAVAAREKALKVDTSAAFSDGWVAGRDSIGCLGGFRIDARTGTEVRRLAELKP